MHPHDSFEPDLLDIAEPYGVDANGNPTSLAWFAGGEVIIHHADPYPESDITEVRGIRVTTALRTVIDLGAELPRRTLDDVLDDCLRRRLFTIAQAWERLDQPDMAQHPGAAGARDALRRRR
jgi:hypothetical protein